MRNRLGLLVEPGGAWWSTCSSWSDLMVDAAHQTLITSDHVTPDKMISLQELLNDFSQLYLDLKPNIYHLIMMSKRI